MLCCDAALQVRWICWSTLCKQPPEHTGLAVRHTVQRSNSSLSNHVTLHVTRCAAEDVEFVVAALLHDIGELLVPISHGTRTVMLLLPMPSALPL